MLGGILACIGMARIMLWQAIAGSYGSYALALAITVGLSLVGVVLWGQSLEHSFICAPRSQARSSQRLRTVCRHDGRCEWTYHLFHRCSGSSGRRPALTGIRRRVIAPARMNVGRKRKLD